MVKKKTTFLTKETKEGLKALDNWLATQPWTNSVEIETAMGVRTMITEIEDRGYYDTQQQELLNVIRNEWWNENYNGQWACRYCCKSTKDVDYDYLSGTDHLSCALEREL